MTPRAAWRWCALAGAFAFLCSWGFGRIPGLVACGPTHGLGPIIAFELARTPAEVAALFGTGGCRATLIEAQRTALLLDAIGFIPGYTAFLLLAARAAAGRRPLPLAAALVVAGLCDEIEGGLLTAILRDLPGTPGLLAALFWAVHVKFALLAAATLAIGGVLTASRRATALLFGLAVLVGGAEAAFQFLTLPTPAMMRGFTHAWVWLLLAALIASARASLFSPATARPLPPRAAPIP